MFSTPIVRPMPKISRRSVELGTENAFVVLADIHFGARVAAEGQHIRFSQAGTAGTGWPFSISRFVQVRLRNCTKRETYTKPLFARMVNSKLVSDYTASREAIEAGIARMADFIRRNTLRAA